MVGFAITGIISPDNRNEFFQVFVMLEEMKEPGDSWVDYAIFFKNLRSKGISMV